MGCILELIGDIILEGWFELMLSIVPDKMKNKTVRIVLKVIAGLFSCALLVSMFIGIVAIFDDEEYVRQLGRYLLFIPLGISLVQIGIGTLIRANRKDK